MGEDKSQQNSQAPQKKKTSRLKVALIILGLVLALLALKIVFILTAKPTITVDYVAEWNRISKPADYDPNQNAAFDYQKAIDALVQMPDEISHTEISWPDDMNDALLDTLEKWLSESAPALAHLKRGSQKSYCWMQDSYPDNSLAKRKPGLQLWGIRELAQLICWHAKFEAAKGRIDQAAEGLIAGYRFTSHFVGTKPTICQLVGISLSGMVMRDAFVILYHQKPDSKTLAHLQQKFEHEFSEIGNELDFRFEKLATYDLIQRVFTDNGRGNGRLIPDAATAMVFISQSALYGGQPPFSARVADLRNRAYAEWLALTGPDRKETTVMSEELFEYLEKLKNKSFWQLHNEEAETREKMQAGLEQYLVLFWHGGRYGLFGHIELYQRRKAQQNALITTVAVLRYKQDRGRYPQTLDEVVTGGYLKEFPMDPFSEGPLSYKPTDDSFLLYSLGEDCDDDGATRSNLGMYGGDQVFWPVERPKEK
ncbi:MAG: hypothetical protein ACYTBJ_21540 [Planctomycetota bacterium]|jgi:hypothetical protein